MDGKAQAIECKMVGETACDKDAEFMTRVYKSQHIWHGMAGRQKQMDFMVER